MKSVWMAAGDVARGFDALSGRLDVDIAIVGGGITGVSVALPLIEAGLSVALVEADRIGAGNTGRSTGNLYGTISRGLQTLRQKWPPDVVRQAVRLRLRAVEYIERNVQLLGIDCDFTRVPQYIGVQDAQSKALESLQEEFSALEEAQLAPSWTARDASLPLRMQRALRMEGQAQLNPYLYAQALAAHLKHRGARIFERSRVLEIDAGDGRVCTDGGELHAKSIVIATHSPIGFNLVQAEMQPYVEYGVSARLRGDNLPPGIFWLRDGSLSVRSYRHGDADRLVVVGETHKTGEDEEGGSHLERLRDFARSHFEVDAFEHGWSAQQLRPADGLPYIGRSAHNNVYIATGFAADGLTWGAAAAMLIADLVRDRENEDTELLSPRRVTPVKSGKVWLAENVAVMKHLVGDRLESADTDMLSAVAVGEGRIVEIQDRKYAVYRAQDGTLSVLSPVCPHLKCHVAWNPDQLSWDCPCHGSRFHPDGRVMDGPAISDLERFPVERG